jgi:hypothetical protein
VIRAFVQPDTISLKRLQTVSPMKTKIAKSGMKRAAPRICPMAK